MTRDEFRDATSTIVGCVVIICRGFNNDPEVGFWKMATAILKVFGHLMRLEGDSSILFDNTAPVEPFDPASIGVATKIARFNSEGGFSIN